MQDSDVVHEMLGPFSIHGLQLDGDNDRTGMYPRGLLRIPDMNEIVALSGTIILLVNLFPYTDPLYSPLSLAFCSSHSIIPIVS